MRRLLVAAGVVSIAASTAAASPTGTVARYNCGAKAMTFYFWPQGHAAIPSIGFPEFLTPHLEAYVTGGPQVGYVDFKGGNGFAKSCKKKADLAAHFAGAKKTIAKTMLVKCTLPAAAELSTVKSAGGYSMLVAVGHTARLAASVTMKSTGSKLTYDPHLCRTSPAPAAPKPAMYSFSGLTAAFDAQGVHGIYTFSGKMCGDPSSTPWALTFVFLTGAPFTQQVVLRPGTPTPVSAYVAKDQSGAELAKITLSLAFGPGPPPQVALSETHSGNVSNIQLGPPAAATVTSVTSCP